MHGSSDSELLARYASARDESAFAELVSSHAPMVWRTCLRVLNDQHEAEDAAQAAFLILARHSDSFRSGGDVAGWLYGIAQRTAREALRSRTRRSRKLQEAAMVKAAESNTTAAASESDIKEQRTSDWDAIDRELDALPSAQRQAVVLRYLEGHSIEEAARIAGCPTSTLGLRATTGLERLRSRLARRDVCLGATVLLLGLFEVEAHAAMPATLLPSILAVPKLTAASAAAGTATHAKVISLAEEVMKILFWAKVKLVALVLMSVCILGGGGGLWMANLQAEDSAEKVKNPPVVVEKKPAVVPVAKTEIPVGIREKLGVPISLEISKKSLTECLLTLSKSSGLRIVPSTDLKDAASRMISLKADKQSMKAVLDDLAKNNELAWLVQGDAVVIFPQPVEKTVSTIDSELYAKLSKKVDLDFSDTSLEDALNFLNSVAGVTITLAPEVKDKATASVNLNVRAMALGHLLEWILELSSLDYQIKDGAILLVNRDAKAVRPAYNETGEWKDSILVELQKKIGSVGTFEATPVEDAISMFTQFVRLNIFVDPKVQTQKRTEVRITLDKKNAPAGVPVIHQINDQTTTKTVKPSAGNVTLKVTEVETLGEALDDMLKQLGLAAELRHGAIFISKKENLAHPVALTPAPETKKAGESKDNF